MWLLPFQGIADWLTPHVIQGLPHPGDPLGSDTARPHHPCKCHSHGRGIGWRSPANVRVPHTSVPGGGQHQLGRRRLFLSGANRRGGAAPGPARNTVNAEMPPDAQVGNFVNFYKYL